MDNAPALLIVPAAGSGQRLGRSEPKALVPVGGRPLVRITLERLLAAAPFVETIVTAPEDSLQDMRTAVADLDGNASPVRVIVGGATRQQSVSLALGAARSAASLVCVHDAARVLVTAETVRAVLAAAAEHGAVTAASPVTDSVRELDADGTTRPLDRSKLWLVQTPQAFERSVLVDAHRLAIERGVQATDDAQLAEAAGVKVTIVESKGVNLKITGPDDLEVARVLLALNEG